MSQLKTPEISIPLDNCTVKCTYKAKLQLEVGADVVASLLIIRNYVHLKANASYLQPKLPNIYFPRVGRECFEVCNAFVKKVLC